MFQTKVVEKFKTHFLCSVTFFPKIVPHMSKWRMRIACWITKATNTHSEYVILIAFPLQQWLLERASIYVIRALPVLSCLD